MTSPTLAAIHVYPVKSCRAVALGEAVPCFLNHDGPGTNWRERPLAERLEVVDGFVAAFRAALNAALEKYASVKFHEGGAKASGFVFSSPPCAQIFISAHNESFKNFRVGTWASQWQADLDLGAGGFTLKVGRGGSQQGQVRLHAHYFEDGNLMFKIEKMLAGSGSADGPAALAEAVVRQIVDL